MIEEGVIFEGTCSMASFQAEMPALIDSKDEKKLEPESVEMISAQAWPPNFEPSDNISSEESGEESATEQKP